MLLSKNNFFETKNNLFFLFSCRERLADVHDEYEERERRWNRIASLLDREDLGSNSSSSSTSIGMNQHLANSVTGSLNNGSINPSGKI